MKIAFISYEYPPDTGFGGIGTYTYQVAHMMLARGHEVEVFAGAGKVAGTASEEGIMVHRLKPCQRGGFRQSVLEKFKERQCSLQFDIVEGAEHKAEAIALKKQFPETPLVVKLHTPSYLLGKLFRGKVNTLDKIRFLAGGMVRGKMPKPYWSYRKEDDLEYQLTKLADGILTPSKDLGRIVAHDWEIDHALIHYLPNLYAPKSDLLQIPVNVSQQKQTNLTFIGKLERRKGIASLVDAAKTLLQQYPSLTIYLIGAYDHPSPERALQMDAYIRKNLKKFDGRVILTGALPGHQLPQYLAKTTIAIFPSIWENFPYVCLEAMSAGRAVIGSKAGGMAEMIEHGKNGLLVPPQSPQDIVSAVSYLVENPEKRMEFGTKAREKVLQAYNQDVIGAKTEAIYQKVIDKKKKDYA